RSHERHLIARILVERDTWRGQDRDAIYVERRRAPRRGHELDQRSRITRRRLEALARPVVDRAVLAPLQVGITAFLPFPTAGAHPHARLRAIEVERTPDLDRTVLASP